MAEYCNITCFILHKVSSSIGFTFSKEIKELLFTYYSAVVAVILEKYLTKARITVTVETPEIEYQPKRSFTYSTLLLEYQSSNLLKTPLFIETRDLHNAW